jgi:hypothetical protein
MGRRESSSPSQEPERASSTRSAAKNMPPEAQPDRPASPWTLNVAGRSFHWTDLTTFALAAFWFAYATIASSRTEAIASDDAFISFQYARNLANGHGLVFNQGERVWGFTSPLQTVLLGGLSAFGLDTVRTAFVTAFLWISGSALLLYRLGLAALSRAFAVALAGFFLFDQSQHGNYGLESNLLIFLQLGFLVSILGERPRTAAVVGALACLARPDSVLLVVPILLATSQTRRLRPLAIFAGIGAAWEIFAYLYFGSFLPQSFYGKVGLTRFAPFFGDAFRETCSLGLAPVFGFSAEPSTLRRIAIVVLSICPLLSARVRGRFIFWFPLVLYPWLLILAYSYIGSFKGHHWEFFSAKFFLGVAVIVGTLTVFAAAVERLPRPKLFARVLLVVTMLVVGVNSASRAIALPKQFRAAKTVFYAGLRYDAFRRVAEWTKANLSAGSTIQVGEFGTLAYFSDCKILDVSGIVTKGIPAHERSNDQALLNRFRPPYALIYFNRATLSPSASLHYDRIAYFPFQGYAQFSLLQRR